MGGGAGIPWARINDYLAELGTAGGLDDFARLALHNMRRIIPFDANAMFVVTNRLGQVRSWKTIIDSEKWLAPFNDYYYRIMPNVAGRDVMAIDWYGYSNREYVHDFIKPQGLRYTIGVFRLGHRVDEAVLLTAHRSPGSRRFNETEQMICRIVQPHLANLFTLITKINRLGRERYHYAELAEDCKLLSKREAEVAALLCLRLTRPEIAARLMLSPRTVEYYIMNIYGKLKVGNKRELLAKLAPAGERTGGE